MAKTTAQIWSENHAASILHYFREMGSPHLVDDTCGLHSVKLEQKTLQGYLELAFTAGEAAEFERLDRRAKAGDPIAKAIKAAEEKDFGANNTTNTGADGLLPALS
jgi:hypothetical protein